jgi:hypothetical protein
VAVDVLGSRAVFAAGLVLSGLVNLACGSTTSFVVMSGLWAANGFFQGFGGPACAKLLTQWIPIKERGFWYDLPSPEGPQLEREVSQTSGSTLYTCCRYKAAIKPPDPLKYLLPAVLMRLRRTTGGLCGRRRKTWVAP